MKKILVIAALFASVMAASAQQFGVKGGLTLSTVGGSDNPKENKDVILYEAGVLYKADLGGGFAIQPALGYQLKGAKFTQNSTQNTVETKTGYVELSVGAQWGPDLVAFRPYVFVEPFIGYAVSGKESLTNRAGTTVEKINAAIPEAKNKLEFGAGAGLGLEVTRHIQVSCQVFQNFGKLYKEDRLNKDDLKGIKSSYVDLKSYQGVKVTLAVLF
ncbi:MAG: PorT family protein [Bacteroidales bacterium]|nr:PorT family protein [Bacteroidales bacterium]